MSRLLLLLLVPLLSGCAGGADRADLTVLAAASLTDAFEELATDFEARHDVDVRFSFGSSTDLAAQAAEGAPGDVLATADEASMRAAEEAGVTGEVVAFAANELVIVTPPDDPAAVDTVDDLARADWVRCADEAPCGRAARALLDTHGISTEPVSLEEDVRATLDKVISGEAEAGLVYATDAAAAGGAVATVPIPGAEEQRTTYHTAPLNQAADVDLAREWIEWVISAAGRRVLAEAGFGRP